MRQTLRPLEVITLIPHIPPPPFSSFHSTSPYPEFIILVSSFIAISSIPNVGASCFCSAMARRAGRIAVRRFGTALDVFQQFHRARRAVGMVASHADPYGSQTSPCHWNSWEGTLELQKHHSRTTSSPTATPSSSRFAQFFNHERFSRHVFKPTRTFTFSSALSPSSPSSLHFLAAEAARYVIITTEAAGHVFLAPDAAGYVFLAPDAAGYVFLASTAAGYVDSSAVSHACCYCRVKSVKPVRIDRDAPRKAHQVSDRQSSRQEVEEPATRYSEEAVADGVRDSKQKASGSGSRLLRFEQDFNPSFEHFRETSSEVLRR
jgi:hypothetical protein